MFCMTAAIFSYGAPFLINMIIDFVKDPEAENTYGFKLLGILIGTQLLAYIINEHMTFYQILIGVKSSNALISMIY